MLETLVLILEIVGTVAFAVSGAMVAVKKKMDVLGVVILGLTTAVGGGIIRDLLLGEIPPRALASPLYTFIAIGTSAVVFFPLVRHVMDRHEVAFRRLLLVMDSLGLGIFTVIGISYSVAVYDNAFLAVFVGVMTGVGGGVLRDLMAGDTPSIFVRHFYASASILGAVATVLLLLIPDFEVFALSIGLAVVFILRLLAARFHWKLPHAA